MAKSWDYQVDPDERDRAEVEGKVDPLSIRRKQLKCDF